MRFIAFAAAFAASLPAFAAGQPAGPGPGDSASPPAYRSAFQDLPRGVVDDALDWKKANADVAQFPRGHGDWLKWEEQQGAGVPPAPAPAPTGGMPPAATPAPGVPPAGHRHEGGAP